MAADGAEQLVRDALADAQATVRAYDTKAQIVGIGYIFALGLVDRIGVELPYLFATGILSVGLSWATLILPAVLFGLVLYPSRRALVVEGERRGGAQGVLYVRPGDFPTVDAYSEVVREAEPLREFAFELLKVSELRETKRKRFIRALIAAGLALSVMLALQLLRALAAA